jgi:anti-sigma regulatory factor (Ser/Thr protein kinase)
MSGPGQDRRVSLMTQDWSGPAIPATVALLRNALADFAAAEGLSGLGLADLRVCVSEAVTNAVMHAYRDDRARGTISITA